MTTKNDKFAIYVLIILTIFSIALTILNYINTPKIGYIDSSILIQQYPGAVKARETFDTESQEWNTNIQTLEKEIEDLTKEMMENGNSWNKKKLKEEKTKLENKQKDYYRYRSAIEEKANIREQEIMQPVFDELNAMVKEYAESKGIDIVFGTVTGGNILYGNNKIDLTKKFLRYAKKNYID